MSGGRGIDTSGAEVARVESALEKAEEFLSESVRKKAATYVQDAVDALGSFARGESVNGVEPKDNTVRASARDIIEFAGGRPETRDPKTSDPSQQVHIYIQRFSDGKLVEADGTPIDIDAERVDDPLAMAEAAAKSVGKTYSLPEMEVNAEADQ